MDIYIYMDLHVYIQEFVKELTGVKKPVSIDNKPAILNAIGERPTKKAKHAEEGALRLVPGQAGEGGWSSSGPRAGWP